MRNGGLCNRLKLQGESEARESTMCGFNRPVGNT